MAELYGTERISGSERIASLDVLRGIAILFILFMNIPEMGNYYFIIHDPRVPTWTTADWWSWWAQMTFMDGTQRGLLELLFGAGIVIMARRAMDPDGPVAVADLHYRRNLWLCAFGLFNAFVLMWYGDILVTYGLAAVFLFPFRTVKPKWLVSIAGVFLAMLLIHNYSAYREDVGNKTTYERVAAATAAHHPVSAEDKKVADEYRDYVQVFVTPPLQHPKQLEKIRKVQAAYASGLAGYWGVQFEQWKKLWGWFWIIEAEIVATMLIGMALFRWGIIQGRASNRTYLALLVVGYGFGLTLRGQTAWLWANNVSDPLWQQAFYDLSRIAVTFGHLALIQLGLRSRAGQMLLRPFEAAGKIPLTIYLGTSLLTMCFLFAPWGLGLFGRIGFAMLMATAATIIFVELIAANVWLRYYEAGPLEWVWKSLAYQRRMPFRRRPTEPDLPPGLVPAE